MRHESKMFDVDFNRKWHFFGFFVSVQMNGLGFLLVVFGSLATNGVCQFTVMYHLLDSMQKKKC